VSHHVSLTDLADLIKSKKQELGLSTRALAKIAGLDNGNIVRIEQGTRPPKPETLSKLATALQLPLADLYHLAGYEIPNELPSMPIYLRTKYKNLSKEAQAELEAKLQELQKRHAQDKGPEPGEDEQP
jgi:transcriptional regulator with XRE-family HTH domain